MRIRTLIVASSSLALLACGGGDGLDNASDAFKASIQASCEKAFDCMASYDASMNNDTPFAQAYGTSVSDCVSQTTELIMAFLGADYFAKLDASVAAGRVTYDAGDAQACLDASSGQTCDQFFGQNGAVYTPPAVCDTALRGTVATGGTCTIENDCAVSADTCDDTTMTCTAG
ncbi:MAG: hypothetical protein JNK64_32320 [Myxococcales bacterium]|nr:hypothetical protein [Myxococcales bacterium]